MRVLQGLIDTAGQANRYARALRAQGVTARSWVFERPIKSQPYDKILDLEKSGLFQGRVRRFSYWLQAAASFNVWHIHKGFSFFHEGKDLRWARMLGKTILIHYRGREVRPEMEMTELPARVINKIRRESELAHAILVKDGQLADLIRPYVGTVRVFPNIVELPARQFPSNVPSDYNDSKRKLRVVHVPSNPKLKGTEFIRLAAGALHEHIDYRELTGLSHEAALLEFWNADVVIDQLLTGTYGNTSLEAMAIGRCVINYLNPIFTAYEPEIPPIINASRYELAERLRQLAGDREQVWRAGERGKDFIQEHHTFDGVGKKLVSLYNELIIS